MYLVSLSAFVCVVPVLPITLLAPGSVFTYTPAIYQLITSTANKVPLSNAVVA